MRPLLLIVPFCFAVGCREEGTVYRPWDGDRVTIAAALMTYKATTGEFPLFEQGLIALVNRPKDLPPEVTWKQIMKKVPRDPWGQEYQYFPPTRVNPPTFEVRGFGPDGVRSEDDFVAIFRADTSTIEQTN